MARISTKWLAVLALGWGTAGAQTSALDSVFNALDKPVPSQAADLGAYRADVARHLAQSYRLLVHPGAGRPKMQDHLVVETTIGSDGAVQRVEVVRAPAQTRLVPWITMLIEAAQPFPAAARLGAVVVRESWWITVDGRFQLESLQPVPRDLSLAEQP